MDKLKIDNHQLLVVKKTDHNSEGSENRKEIDKEILRRLRIQNKKLIEQVAKLKEEIRRTKKNRIQVLNHINELLKLIDK
jgi:hypothetical protein